MANTTPESTFSKIDKETATITVCDGHVADANDIQKAINGGFVHFYNLEYREDYCCETDLLCSKRPLKKKEIEAIKQKLDEE